MTREEAIQILSDLQDGSGQTYEAIRMAIEALSAEESVTLYATPKATYIRPLTEEIAIEFLQDSGWLPNHDKEIGNPPMLVRCKDCRWWDREDKYCTDGGGLCGGITEDDYCSRAVRR